MPETVSYQESTYRRHFPMDPRMETLQSADAEERDKIDAFSSLVEEFNPDIIEYVTRFLSTTQRAEDVAQDVFIKLWEHPHSYRHDPQAPLEAWLFRVTRNRAIDVLRKSYNRQEILCEEVRPVATSHHMNDPAEVCIQRSTLLNAIAQSVTNQTKVAFIPWLFQAKTAEEGAGEAGISESAYNSSVSGARLLARRALEKQGLQPNTVRLA